MILTTFLGVPTGLVVVVLFCVAAAVVANVVLEARQARKPAVVPVKNPRRR